MTPHEQMQAQRKRIAEVCERLEITKPLHMQPKPTLLARIKRWLKGWRK